MKTPSHDFVWPPASNDDGNPNLADPQARTIVSLNTTARSSGGASPLPPALPSHGLRRDTPTTRRAAANARLPRGPSSRRAASFAIAALASVAAIEAVVIAIQFSENTAQTKAIAGIVASTAAIARSSTLSVSGIHGTLPTPLATTAAHDVASASDYARPPTTATAADRPQTSSRSTRRPAQTPQDNPRPRAVTADQPAAAASPSAQAYGLLYVNALPWADVSIDGHPAGQTPLGRIQLSPGVHQVRFTHPDYGEQVREVVIKPDAPTRVGVDLRQ